MSTWYKICTKLLGQKLNLLRLIIQLTRAGVNHQFTYYRHVHAKYISNLPKPEKGSCHFYSDLNLTFNIHCLLFLLGRKKWTNTKSISIAWISLMHVQLIPPHNQGKVKPSLTTLIIICCQASYKPYFTFPFVKYSESRL